MPSRQHKTGERPGHWRGCVEVGVVVPQTKGARGGEAQRRHGRKEGEMSPSVPTKGQARLRGWDGVGPGGNVVNKVP